MPALETLRKSTKFFSPFTQKQLILFQDYFRFLSFKEKTQITRRGEPVDFLGFILKGQVHGFVENQHKITLAEGDCLGHMACMKLAGCEVQQIDYFAKEDGYIAIIRLDDLRILQKRDSEFSTFIYKQISLFTLNSVSQQYLGQEYQSIPEQTIVETTTKKIMFMLDQLGVKPDPEPNKKKKEKQMVEEPRNLRFFWNQLEQRDKRAFVQNCTLIETKTQELLVRAHQASNVFYIVLDGELIEFQQNQPSVIFKQGDTIGLKQFLINANQENNIISRMKCLLLRITKSNLDDIATVSGQSVCSIITMLTRFEAQKLKELFEKQFKDEQQGLQKKVVALVDELSHTLKSVSKKDQQSANQLMNNFFEIDVNKMKQDDKSAASQLEKQIIAPLYLLDVYKDLVAKRYYQPNEVKDRKDPMFESGLSIFIRDKLNEQRTQALKKKEELKKARKQGKTIKEEDDDIEIHMEPNQLVLEELNNDYYKIVDERDKFQEYTYLLEQQIKQMKDEFKEMKEEHQRMQTQIRKNEMHKELLSLDLASQLLQPTDRTTKKKHTLYDNYLVQVQENKKFKKTVQVAEKVLTMSQLHKLQS
ncbi:unnamed protein product [Paramecium octaurelia]|uniref:Cyclic nucleotide-binding domain-containing protein n=1 Tax=Paramecium octaurelia TaxID=43137 RepID=A0A8S1UMK5_PAROT|nr:unnamed protein product [Paramecium octaurelia]